MRGRARSGRLPCARRGRIGQWLRQNNGALYIRCTAVLSQIMDETAEELIFEEKGQSARTEQSGNLESLKPPQIRGTSTMRYQIGDQLQLNCSSSGSQSLPAPYLEWFVNNRRINEQYVHNYAKSDQWPHLAKQSADLRPVSGRSPNGRPSVVGHSTSDVQMPQSNPRSSSLSKSSARWHRPTEPPTTEATNDKNKIEYQNDYLFSNYLKKLNLLQQRNKNGNLSLSLSSLLQSDNNLTELFAHPNASAADAFNQPTGIYNNNVNLTRLQNTIYQHYADYSLKPAQHRTHNIGIRFRVLKKHYQVRCSETPLE